MITKKFLLSLALVTFSFAQSSMAANCSGTAYFTNGKDTRATSISISLQDSSSKGGNLELRVPEVFGEMIISAKYKATGKIGVFKFGADLGDGVKLNGEIIKDTNSSIILSAELKASETQKMQLMAPVVSCQ